MKKTLLLLLLLLLTTAGIAQEKVVPPYNDPTIIDYTLPKTVGVAQIAYSEAWKAYQKNMPHHFTTKELFDDLGYHGIRAVRLWLTVPFDDGIRASTSGGDIVWVTTTFEDMREVWEHPDVDVIMVILTDMRHTGREIDCDGKPSMTWINDPVEEFARFMFEHFSDQDKTVIIANTETDNQWRGFRCDDPEEMIWDSIPPADVAECLAANTREECVREFSYWRMKYALRQIEKRQRIVEEVRSEYPGAALKLRTSMTVHVFNREQAQGKYLGQFALSWVRKMTYKPDYIGISFWRGAKMTLTEAIQYVHRITHYPRNRMIIDQIGQNEKEYGRQYSRITKLTHEAWANKINLVLVWMWKTTWSVPPERNKGMWNVLCEAPNPWCGWGEPNSGLGAIYELNEEAGGN
jgi:hypothetical protein